MEYGGYKVTGKNNTVIIENVADFNPVHIFECGQCFRWIRQNDGSYTGVVKDRVVNVRCDKNRLVISNSSIQDFMDLWFDYLDLGRDYSKIKAQLSKDEITKKAIDFGYGIRLLKQDIRETLISFIISANNRIPMIKRTVAAIAKAYGREIRLDGEAHYTFPGVERLSNTSLEQLEVCRGGFRCKYIVEASMMIARGEVNLDGLGCMSTENARNELKKLPGVGPKVADCVLLYSGTKCDVFPTDVWVKRVMEGLYFKREAGLREIQDFARKNFGELGGFAQQYLFYYARENRIGTEKTLKM